MAQLLAMYPYISCSDGRLRDAARGVSDKTKPMIVA